MVRDYAVCCIGELLHFQAELDQLGEESIDALLEYRPEYMRMGRGGMAAALIPHEQHSTAWLAGQERWYQYLVACMKDGAESYRDNRLTVVTFNYDRSLEQALSAAFGGPDVLDHVPVLHPYGTIGGMLNKVDSLPYASPLTPETLSRAADSIRVVHEDHYLGTQVFEQAQRSLLDADVVAILGFGFYERNVERLKLYDIIQRRPGPSDGKSVFASAIGLSSATKDNLREVGVTFGGPNEDCLAVLTRFRVIEC